MAALRFRYAPPTTSHSAGGNLALTNNTDHSVGADQSFEGGVEKSTVFDGLHNNQAAINRLALTFAAGYSAASLVATSAVEYRQDNQQELSQTSWLFKDKIEIRPDESWRILGSFEYAFTDVSAVSLQASDYTRVVAGLAYRPIAHDKLNLVARYTYFRDLGPSGQIMTNGGIEQPKQVSEVISLDVNYDLNRWLTIGGRYASRYGRVSISRVSDRFVDSSANLYVVRADMHFSPDWDALIEQRYMVSARNTDSRHGTLVALYRHLGSGMKLGFGYNFSKYSTDMTDQSYSAKGIFVNLLAAF